MLIDPSFYWKNVYGCCKHAIRYLQATQEGRSYLAHLYSNVFAVEHENNLQPLSAPAPAPQAP